MTELRSNFREIAERFEDKRPPDQILEHYEFEVQLAERLRGLSKNERRQGYRTIYQELFRSLPHHPAHTNKSNTKSAVHRADMLRRFISSSGVFVEIGAGDCLVAMEMARHCARAVAVDVTDVVLGREAAPKNFDFVLTDGVILSLGSSTADLVYSNQVMEHLHPDDAYDQLREILRVLKPGGKYLCITPNRISGPHDVSRYVDETAKGLHLREYTYAELGELFLAAGFSAVKPVFLGRGRAVDISFATAKVVETVVDRATFFLKYRPGHKTQALLGINLLACK